MLRDGCGKLKCLSCLHFGQLAKVTVENWWKETAYFCCPCWRSDSDVACQSVLEEGAHHFWSWLHNKDYILLRCMWQSAHVVGKSAILLTAGMCFRRRSPFSFNWNRYLTESRGKCKCKMIEDHCSLFLRAMLDQLLLNSSMSYGS